MSKKTKKPKALHNILESLDQFKIDHNFQYTKKKAKGSITGFVLTMVYYLLLAGYFHNRVSLFWSHAEDKITSYKEVVN